MLTRNKIIILLLLGIGAYLYWKSSSAMGHVDLIPGGLADDKSPDEFNPLELRKGTAVEMEHTSDPDIAREIAMDHLTEDPAYYKKLAKMEGH